MKHIFDAICKLFDFIKSAPKTLVDIEKIQSTKGKILTFVWFGFHRITVALQIKLSQTKVEKQSYQNLWNVFFEWIGCLVYCVRFL